MRPGRWMTIGIALTASFSVHAQPDMEERFGRLDADRNGEIGWAEAYLARTMEFVNLDRNTDGLVEKGKFRGRASPFVQFDANADGKLDLSEYLAHHRTMLGKADTDGNGTVNLQEFERIQRSIRNQAAQK